MNYIKSIPPKTELKYLNLVYNIPSPVYNDISRHSHFSILTAMKLSSSLKTTQQFQLQKALSHISLMQFCPNFLIFSLIPSDSSFIVFRPCTMRQSHLQHVIIYALLLYHAKMTIIYLIPWSKTCYTTFLRSRPGNWPKCTLIHASTVPIITSVLYAGKVKCHFGNTIFTSSTSKLLETLIKSLYPIS